MPSTFPTSLQDLDATRGTANQPLSNPSHVAQHTLEDQTIEALETKVGIDGSADTTTIDYKLKNAASINPGHKHSLAAGVSDVAITNPQTGNGLIYNASTGKWENGTSTIADASTTVKGLTKLTVAPASATEPIAVGDNDGRVPTQAENDALAGTSTPSSSNKYVNQNEAELLANKDTTTTLGTSDTKYPSQKAVKTYVDNGDFQEVTISTAGTTNWICPRGVTQIYVDMVGGGGGGGAGSYDMQAAAGGGGGGAGLKNQAVTVVPLTAYTIIVGAKGIGQVRNGANPTDGGDTIAFGYTCAGGKKGVDGSVSTPGAGGAAGNATAGAGGAGGAANGSAGTAGGTGTGGGTGGNGGANPNNSAYGSGGGGGAGGLGGTGGTGTTGPEQKTAGSIGMVGCGGGGGAHTVTNYDTEPSYDGGTGLVVIKIPTRQIF